MDRQETQDINLDRPLDLVEFDMFSRLGMIVDRESPKYLAPTGVPTLDRLRETGVIEGDTHRVSIATSDPLTGLTVEDEAEAKRHVFDLLMVKTKGIEGFDLIVFDPDTITVTLEDGCIVSCEAEAQLYALNHAKARQVVDHYRQPKFEGSFDEILLEASIAAGERSKK